MIIAQLQQVSKQWYTRDFRKTLNLAAMSCQHVVVILVARHNLRDISSVEVFQGKKNHDKHSNSLNLISHDGLEGSKCVLAIFGDMQWEVVRMDLVIREE